MNCRICDTDLTGLDIEYHFSKNHMTEPDARDYILGYRDAGSMIASLREENARLTRERDEARAELASLEVDYAEAQDIAVSESAGRRAAEAKLAAAANARVNWQAAIEENDKLKAELEKVVEALMTWQQHYAYRRSVESALAAYEKGQIALAAAKGE